MNQKQKIFVGVSGGVDSSVVAHLLKAQGHDVHGVFIKTWSPEWLPCTWLDEKRDAMRVCAALDIPFHFLDAQEAYKTGVAEYMIAEYKAGRTPNPDVLCNRVIKFGVLWHYAQEHGAQAVATGHYAQIKDGSEGLELHKGIDPAKDQSYFLWMLDQGELGHIHFPIGHLSKDTVRTLAKRAELFTATKKDSQGICFLGNVDMREFLAHYIEMKKGNIVDTDGAVLGEHDGVWFYTLGERHGLRITVTGTTESPYYVVGKDIEHNILIVSREPLNPTVTAGKVTLALRETNWLIPPTKDREYVANIRYHGSPIAAHIKNQQEVIVNYEGVIALGQSLVLYDGERVVGGGIIDSLS